MGGKAGCRWRRGEEKKREGTDEEELYRRSWALYPDIPKGSGHASHKVNIRGVVNTNYHIWIQASVNHYGNRYETYSRHGSSEMRSRKQSEFQIIHKQNGDEVKDSVARKRPSRILAKEVGILPNSS